MVRRIDPRIFNNLIDAHILDRKGGPDDALVEEILALASDHTVPLMLPHSVRAEINHPNTPADVKRRAAALIFTEPVSLTPGELDLHKKAREILQGNAKPGKHDRDAYHVVESAKYGGYFITNDQRILDKRDALLAVLGNSMAIVSPSEFLGQYRYFEGRWPKARI